MAGLCTAFSGFWVGGFFVFLFRGLDFNYIEMGEVNLGLVLGFRFFFVCIGGGFRLDWCWGRFSSFLKLLNFVYKYDCWKERGFFKCCLKGYRFFKRRGSFLGFGDC